MLIIGHRGSAGNSPENTLLSFEKAIAAGVQMIELDVHRCKSGELIVMHDNKVNRTTDGRGAVAHKTWFQLSRLDAGEQQKIPLLKEVIEFVNRRVKINIELKGNKVAEDVFLLIESYKKEKGWQTDDFYISSFDHSQLFDFRRLDYKTPIGILYNRFSLEFQSTAKKLQATSVNIPLKSVTKKNIDKIHENKLQVWVYTVNRLSDLQKLEKLGVDAVFTNFPEQFIRYNH